MKIKRQNLINIAMGFIVLFFLIGQYSCSSGSKKEITFSGAFALYPMAQKWAEEYHKIRPDIRIDISAGGAGKGMSDALSDMVDLGMISRDINKDETAKGAWSVSVVKDAVVATMNSNNPALPDILLKGMTKDQFKDLFITQKITDWSYFSQVKGVGKIYTYTRADACGAAETWAKYLGKKQENLKGIGIFGDPGMANAVEKATNSVGYNNINYAYDNGTRKFHDGLVVIPIDVNNNGKIDPEEDFYSTLDNLTHAIQTGNYPSPPARELYFVSHGKPKNPEVIKFLKWVLTEGQKFTNESGYVSLSEKRLKEEIEKL